MTLLAYLRAHLPSAPSVKWLKRSIESKRCRVNGKLETFSTHPMRAGDEVRIQSDEEPLHRADCPLLWEEGGIRAYHKPAGWVTSPRIVQGTLVHRLDKETSGVLLTATTPLLTEAMLTLFRNRAVTKRYLALVRGVVQSDRGVERSQLAPVHHYQGYTRYGSCTQGRLAETAWEVVARGPKATLVVCHPRTGRTHQIRVHLSELGHPIIGDDRYGDSHATRHMLHAVSVQFLHPETQNVVTIQAPLPADFTAALHQANIVCPYGLVI